MICFGTWKNYGESHIWYEICLLASYYTAITKKKGSFWYVKKWPKSAAYWQNQVIFELQREPFFCSRVCYVKGAKKSISHFSAFRRYFCVHFGIMCHKIHSIENEQKKLKKLNFFQFFCEFWDFVKKSKKSQKNPKFDEISNLFKIFSRKDNHLIFCSSERWISILFIKKAPFDIKLIAFSVFQLKAPFQFWKFQNLTKNEKGSL